MGQLIAKGRVSYAYVGISTEDLTPSIAKHFGYPVPYGAIVDCIESGSPGQDAGLRGGSSDVQFNGSAFRRGGDVIVAIDGTPVRNAEDVVRVVTERLTPGGAATLTVYRGAVRKTVAVRLTDRPKTPSRSSVWFLTAHRA